MYVTSKDADSFSECAKPRCLFFSHRQLANEPRYGEKLGYYLMEDLFGKGVHVPRIVAFDVYEEDGKGIKPRGDRKMKGDRDSLFPAMDSAIKSAAYWWTVESRLSADLYSAYVPVLVLSEPWLQVSIDKSEAPTSSEVGLGFMMMGYPLSGVQGTPEWFMTLVINVESLPRLLGVLDRLHSMFLFDVSQVKQ